MRFEMRYDGDGSYFGAGNSGSYLIISAFKGSGVNLEGVQIAYPYFSATRTLKRTCVAGRYSGWAAI